MPPVPSLEPQQPPRGGDVQNYTGKQPTAFVLAGKRREVRTWREVLVGTCIGLLAEVGAASFDQSVRQLRGTRRSYFSRESEALVAPLTIEGSELFVEGNMSANDCVRLARRVLLAVKGPDDELAVEFAL